MPSCPYCYKELDHLRFEMGQTSAGTFTTSQGHEYDCQVGGGPDWEDYFCPECGTSLFTEQQEAEDFLDEVTEDA